MSLIYSSQNQWKERTILRYLIGYLDEVTRSLVLMLPEMDGFVETFKVKGKDKNKNNKLMSFRIDDDKLISIDSLFLNGNKYQLQVYLDNSFIYLGNAYKIVDKLIIHYLDGNPFMADELVLLILIKDVINAVL